MSCHNLMPYVARWIEELAVYSCVKAPFLHAMLEVGHVITDTVLPILPLLSMLQ